MHMCVRCCALPPLPLGCGCYCLYLGGKRASCQDIGPSNPSVGRSSAALPSPVFRECQPRTGSADENAMNFITCIDRLVRIQGNLVPRQIPGPLGDKNLHVGYPLVIHHAADKQVHMLLVCVTLSVQRELVQQEVDDEPRRGNAPEDAWS